ncbi:unnamed protein product [Ilex paraguariensis]|uniref:Uncharacterized protein n=1 Tax=Ilex paraguariensis TaxID=185542 RepID=A0ABC8TRA4_9AQUA
MISLGQGAYNPSLQAFGADQLENEEELPCCKSYQNSDKKSLFFHWWYFGICSGCLLGISFYTYKQEKSFDIKSLENIVRAIKATASRIINGGIKISTRKSEVVELELEESGLCHQDIDGIEGLDKNSDDGIEIAKVVLRLLPIWTMLLMFAVIFQQPATFFTKQGTTMKRNIGSNFKIPPATLQSAITVSVILSMPLYRMLFIPLTRLITRSEKGISVMQRMGIGMFLSVVAMSIAAIVETERLAISRKMGISGSNSETVPLSIFWLLPQYILLGISDVFTVVGMQEFFYTEVPVKMRTMGIALYTSVFGLGSFLSAFLISVIEFTTSSRGGGRQSWFSDDMTEASLDKYYWLLALLSALSLVMFIILCRFHKSKT